jgi:hypothetical protein
VTKKLSTPKNKIHLDGPINADFVPADKQPDFDDSKILQIASRHKIQDKELIAGFKRTLRYASGKYFQYLNHYETRPSKKMF